MPPNRLKSIVTLLRQWEGAAFKVILLLLHLDDISAESFNHRVESRRRHRMPMVWVVDSLRYPFAQCFVFRPECRT